MRFKAGWCNKTSTLWGIFIFIQSLKGWLTKAKEAPSPYEVRRPYWTPTQYFSVFGNIFNWGIFQSFNLAIGEYLSMSQRIFTYFLNKKMSKCSKRIALIFYVHCTKLKESFILSHFSFISNTTNFFIHSLNGFVLKKNCLHVAGFLQLGALYANVPSKCL